MYQSLPSPNGRRAGDEGLRESVANYEAHRRFHFVEATMCGLLEGTVQRQALTLPSPKGRGKTRYF